MHAAPRTRSRRHRPTAVDDPPVGSHRRSRGQTAYTAPRDDWRRFRHARGRATVRPPVRAAATSELPAVDGRPDVVELRYRPPLRVELALYLCAVALVAIVACVPWLVGRLWRIERAVESPVVLISPSPVE